MKYLVYGAGGTGGCLAAFLAKSGKDVSLIARGAHRDAIEENGLVLETGHGTFAVPIPAFEQEHYDQQPDVIFVCVKGYSLEGIFPTLERPGDHRDPHFECGRDWRRHAAPPAPVSGHRRMRIHCRRD